MRGREARQRNFQAWSSDPRRIDFALLTHAHINYSDLRPQRCALGFRGRHISAAPHLGSGQGTP
jgi:metallo-beta-lactamase family protein